MKSEQQWFLFSDIPEEALTSGQSRKILAYNSALMCVHNHFCTGSPGKLHQHPHTQLSYILSGKFEFYLEDEKKILEPGDSLSILPHQVHGCLCLQEGIVLDIFSPMRKDFIN